MGYCKTIKLTEDEFSEIRMSDKDSSCKYTEYKTDLIVKIAKGARYTDIKSFLRLIAASSVWEERVRLTVEYDSEDYTPKGILQVCGWEYAHSAEQTIDDVIESVTSDLYIISQTVPLPDYFDQGERWSQWMEDVTGKIDYVNDEASELYLHSVFDKYPDLYNVDDDPPEDDDPTNDSEDDTSTTVEGDKEDPDYDPTGVATSSTVEEKKPWTGYHGAQANKS